MTVTAFDCLDCSAQASTDEAEFADMVEQAVEFHRIAHPDHTLTVSTASAGVPA